MLRVARILKAGEWTDTGQDRVVLDFDARRRRRAVMTGQKGTQFLLDLPEVAELRGGEGLLLSHGHIVGVVAADEELMELSCGSLEHAVRLAWHLGNRHLPAEIVATSIRIRADHVIADMAEGLGATVRAIRAPFNPERGAYAGGHSHAHGNGSHTHGHHGHSHSGHGHHHD